jgi:hypothetical protein
MNETFLASLDFRPYSMFLRTVTWYIVSLYLGCVGYIPLGTNFQVLELVLVCDRHVFHTKYKATHLHFVTKLDV